MNDIVNITNTHLMGKERKYQFLIICIVCGIADSFQRRKPHAMATIKREVTGAPTLINGKWVHVPNCVDDTPWAEADESPNNLLRLK